MFCEKKSSLHRISALFSHSITLRCYLHRDLAIGGGAAKDTTAGRDRFRAHQLQVVREVHQAVLEACDREFLHQLPIGEDVELASLSIHPDGHGMAMQFFSEPSRCGSPAGNSHCGPIFV